MDVSVEPLEETPGAALSRMLTAYRTFMENVFALMKFIEGEMTKRGWEIVKNGGYGVTRNGYGRGLTSFAIADWVTTQAGIAFVKSGSGRIVGGVSITEIPPEGLSVTTFQVWWNPNEPGEPVVWRARMLVKPDGEVQPQKWEEYQSTVFRIMESESRDVASRSGRIRTGKAIAAGVRISYEGEYIEVPVSSLMAPEDVLSQLLDDLPPL